MEPIESIQMELIESIPMEPIKSIQMKLIILGNFWAFLLIVTDCFSDKMFSS